MSDCKHEYMEDGRCSQCGESNEDILKAENAKLKKELKATRPESLRDEFAMTALAGLLTQPVGVETQMPDDYAWAAYQMADAMMKAREVGDE